MEVQRMNQEFRLNASGNYQFNIDSIEELFTISKEALEDFYGAINDGYSTALEENEGDIKYYAAKLYRDYGETFLNATRLGELKI